LQIVLLRGTLKAIERQAELMERQINKERPRIRVEMQPFEIAPVTEPDGAIQYVSFTVACYGFAHAFVEEDGFEAELKDSEQAEWPLKSVFGISGKSDAVITPSSAPESRAEVFVTSQFEFDSILHRKTFIHFRGRIKYRDFSQAQRETTVYFVWHPSGLNKAGKVVSRAGTWRKAGPQEANHDT
jgi:hypothetical protein